MCVVVLTREREVANVSYLKLAEKSRLELTNRM